MIELYPEFDHLIDDYTCIISKTILTWYNMMSRDIIHLISSAMTTAVEERNISTSSRVLTYRNQRIRAAFCTVKVTRLMYFKLAVMQINKMNIFNGKTVSIFWLLFWEESASAENYTSDIIVQLHRRLYLLHLVWKKHEIWWCDYRLLL